jgi:hypothetical protein
MTTGDPITNLPMDQSQPSQNEIQIVDTLFTKHRSTMDKIVLEAKDSLLIGLLFVVFSLPIVDNLLRKMLPITEPPMPFDPMMSTERCTVSTP